MIIIQVKCDGPFCSNTTTAELTLYRTFSSISFNTDSTSPWRTKEELQFCSDACALQHGETLRKTRI